jgi:DUF4097 and DUF4098 domain-containing protein YvlB
MRRLITLLTLAAAAVSASAGAQSVDAVRHTGRTRVVAAAAVERSAYQRNRDEQTERFTKTVRIGNRGEIDISNVAGDIVITRGGNNDALIEVVKTSRARSDDEARELLQLVDVTIEERSGRVEIRTRYPRDEWRRHNRRNMNVSVAFNISAPAGASVTAKSVSGSIKVTGIKGEVSAESVSGNVVVGDAGHVSQAKSVSGNVEILDTTIEGAVDAGSVSGNVVLRRVKARRLDLGTVSGDLLLEDLECERVSGQSVSGNVNFQGPLARSGRYDLKSHSGEVRVAITGGSGFELEASSFSGHVRSDFPITLQGTGERGRRHPRALHGVYGDGSAVLDLTTFSGSIAIVKR